MAPAPSPRRYLETGVRIMPANLEDSPKSRGTTLFEEFEGIIPYLNRVDERSDLEFIRAVQILLDHFKLLEIENDKGEILVQPIVASLRTLLNDYLKKTMTIPSAIFVVMAYIESAYLQGEDAELVHKLTGLHIERAKSMKQSKMNPEGVARNSTHPPGEPRSRKNLLLAALTSARRAARVHLR